MHEDIQWLGHGSFSIQATPFIYINPWRVIRSVFHADIILVSHDHYDHCSVADIDKLRGPDTIIIGNEAVAAAVPGTRVLRPWHSITVDRVNIKAVPAYSPDDMRHPRSDGGLGFVISMHYFDIYYAGDTKIIPEMDLIHPDIAILPIDDDGTMSVEEAAALVEKMQPRWVFPANWGGTGEGASRQDALRLKQLIGERAQVILPADRLQ